MKAHEFWREHGDGVWAIELEDGRVIGCYGPMDASEVDDALVDDLDFSRERAEWVDGHRGAFELFNPARPYG